MVGKIKENKAHNNYGLYSVGASRAEKSGEFSKAAELWCKALVFARSRTDRHWAEIRLAFCANATQRGWSVPGGCK